MKILKKERRAQDSLFLRLNILKNNEGQSTIEFISAFTLAIAFVFLFVKFAFNMTNGFLVHYATFEASRVYLTHDDNSSDPLASDGIAAQAAEAAFKSINVARFLRDDKVEFTINPPPPATGKSIYVGARASFEQTLGFFKIVGGGTPLNLTSVSFLGREPTRGECVQRICDAIAQSSELAGANCEGNFTTLFDDGC
jgi:hypothetical protein